MFETEEEQAESWLEGFERTNGDPHQIGAPTEKRLKVVRDKEKTMADELSAELRDTNSKLDALLDVLTDQARGQRRRRGREDEPESVREMDSRGRQGEARQVAFEVKVPVGRNGGTLRGMLIFDVSVRDDRDLEDLANEVERKFRSANVFTKQFDRPYNGGGYNGGGGGGYGRPYYDRDRDWRR